MIFQTTWSAPSNIALIKYWGKKEFQYPLNPSLSFSLKNCFSKTSLQIQEKDELNVIYYFDNEINTKFQNRVYKFIKMLASEYPQLENKEYIFNSTNTFPHSTGIASSASSFASIALCLNDFLSKLDESGSSFSFEKSSEFARKASGSASRSLYKNYSVWGNTDILSEANNDFAVEYMDFHPNFGQLYDTVLIVGNNPKKISSSDGHEEFSQSLYKETRIKSANNNFNNLIYALKTGDKKTFSKIIIDEAHSLHAMMMLSPKPYMLMKPNTIAVINLIEDLRENFPEISYTMDAGPNIHLIYFPEHLEIVKKFTEKLKEMNLVINFIDDKIGNGPVKYE